MAKPATLPKGIRMRGDKYFVDVTINGKRKTATCKDLDAAKLKRVEIEAMLRKGNDTGLKESKRGSWMVETACDYTLKHEWAGKSIEKHCERVCDEIKEFFGARTRLDKITTEDMDDWVVAMKERRLSNGTINRKLAALSKIFSTALRRGKISARPIIPRQSEGVGRIRFLSDNEEKAMLDLFKQWCKEDHYDAFIVLIDTGLRNNELWAMTGKDVLLESNMLNVWRNKTGVPTGLGMTTRVREVLARRLETYGEGKLFPGMDNFVFGRVWRRARVHIGLEHDEHFVPYVLRHTCCSRLVQRGVPLMHVKEWMGHKAIQTTMRYAHLAPTHVAAVANVLEPGAGQWNMGQDTSTDINIS